MSAGRNKRTPVRVQVFYFEKKEEASTARGPADTVPMMEAVPDPFATFAPVAAPAGFEPTVKMDIPPDIQALHDEISRRVTPKMPQPVVPSRGLLKGGAAADVPRPRATRKRAPAQRTRKPTPAPVPAPNAVTLEGGSAAQALEYHRLMLQALAARADARSRELIDRAIFGHTLFARGRMREAQVVFESIVAGEPDEAFPYTMLGAIYLAQGDDGRALALFDAALTMDPADPAALVNRAEIRLRRSQPKLALKDLERAITGGRTGPAPFLPRAQALANLARAMVR